MSSETTGTSGVAGRYAKALFELADEQSAIDQVDGDLARIQAMIDESDDLSRMMQSPVISRDVQGRAMDAVLEAAEICDLVRRFTGVAVANRRLFALPDMIEAWSALLSRHRGEVTAEVISATALGQAQLDAVTEALKGALGGKVAVDARVDPGLIGGMVVRVGSRMIDFSLNTKLEKLQLAMKGAA
ncbi:MAG: F0F1 ATP synthase subunit delta [Alphaproteobacteria bacterium]